MLWIDKYRPNSLSKLDVNSQLTERLKAMVREMQILLRLNARDIAAATVITSVL
jgi:hypothetical protein